MGADVEQIYTVTLYINLLKTRIKRHYRRTIGGPSGRAV